MLCFFLLYDNLFDFDLGKVGIKGLIFIFFFLYDYINFVVGDVFFF